MRRAREGDIMGKDGPAALKKFFAERMPAMPLPTDPFILLSYVNTKLRDEFPSLEELCLSLGEEEAALRARLAKVGYEYDPGRNRFR